jgi:tetratricopeptide (TPR) repeat protein
LSPVEFGLSALVIAAQYLGALFFPVNLSYFHTFYPTSGITPGLLISVAALAAAAVAFYRSRTALFRYGILWMAAGLLPALNLTGVGQNVFAERYLYLPSAGFCWIAAWAWCALAKLQPKWAIAGGVLVLLFFAGETITRNRDWRDDFSLFQVTLRQSPTSGWLHNGMAGAYVERNDVGRALQEERMAVEFEPRAPSYRENLGNILLVKDARAAAAEFQKLVALAPDVAKYHCDLGLALEASGDARQAAAEYERALRLQPDNRDAQDGYRRVRTLIAPG